MAKTPAINSRALPFLDGLLRLPTFTVLPEIALAKVREDAPMEGKITIDDLIIHTMPLNEINTAFDLMHEGKSIREVVNFD